MFRLLPNRAKANLCHFLEQELPVQIFRNQDGVVFSCQGQVTRQELTEAKTSLLNLDGQLATLKFALVDQTKADLTGFSTADLLESAKLDRALSSLTSTGIVVAIVVARDVEYGLARMWEAFIDGIGWETGVFRFRSQAEDWIRQRVTGKFGTDLSEFPNAIEPT